MTVFLTTDHLRPHFRMPALFRYQPESRHFFLFSLSLCIPGDLSGPHAPLHARTTTTSEIGLSECLAAIPFSTLHTFHIMLHKTTQFHAFSYTNYSEQSTTILTDTILTRLMPIGKRIVFPFPIFYIL